MPEVRTTAADRVVVVDWSAAAVPRRGRDSIWQADLEVVSGDLVLTNPATRVAWAEAVGARLERAVAAGERVLLAIDAGLGFPTGFGRALGLAGGGWEGTWALLDQMVSDDAGNRNNRFEVAERLNERCGGDGPTSGPFWGHPVGRRHRVLGPRRPTYPAAGLAEWRATEDRARTSGWRVQPVWKLFGAGSVGSQSLLAIAWLERLRREPGLAGRLHPWPHGTGSGGDPWAGRPGVVVVECWPPGFAPDLSVHEVRDAAQVIGTARALARPGELSFAVPDGAAQEEGWILGVR